MAGISNFSVSHHIGNVNIEEVSSDYFAKEYFAERPVCERLVNKRLDDLGLNIMRDWKVALEEYLNDYYPEFVNK